MIAWALVVTRFRGVLGWASRNIAIVMLAALATYAGILFIQRNRARAEARSNSLARDSAEAAASKSAEIAVNERTKRLLGDSMRAFERRTIQAEIIRDVLDKALNRISIARSNVTVTIDTVRASATAPVATDSGDVRRGVFTVREEPVTATATVAMPKPPALGSLDMRFVIDPIRLGVRLQCGEPVRGIKPASIVVTTPPWMNAQIEGTEQRPELCNPVLASSSHRGISRWWIPVAGAASIVGWEGIKQIKEALDKK